MSLFKPLRGSRVALDTQPLHDGYAYFCTDDGSFHIDYADTDGNLQRKQINAKDAETLTGVSLEEIKKSISWDDLTDKPTVISGGDTLTWDGNTEGLVSGLIVGYAAYKVTDVVPTMADLANGATVTDSDGGSFEMAAEEIIDVTERGIPCIMIGEVAVILEDNVDAEGIVAPQKGVYFIRDGDWFQTSLTIPGYTGFTQEKIAPSHLYQPDWNQTDESQPNAILNKPFGDIPTGGDTLTWDGNTEGLVCVADMLYKISDVVLTADDANRAVWTHPEGIFNPIFVDVGSGVLADTTGNVAIVSEGSVEVEGLLFPEAGIYATVGFAGCSLTIPGYTGFPTTKQIDEKYLPEHKHKWDDIEDKPFGESDTVFFTEQEITFEGGEATITVLGIPSVGSDVTVLWDGVEYVCQAADFNGASFIGNGAMVGNDDTGEPFAFMFVSTQNTFAISLDTEKASATVKVSGKSINKIDPKYVSTTKLFYLSESDTYLYTDPALTTKATASEVRSALLNMTVVFTKNEVEFYTMHSASASNQYVLVNLWLHGDYSGACKYYTAEYIPES